MSTSLDMSGPNGSDDSLFPAPSDPTTPSNPSSSRRSGPYSPRPHIFGNPNPIPSRGMGQLGSQDGGTSSAGTAPGVPGMVRPSDLMGIEDYKDLRFNTTVKGGVAGIFSGVGTTLLVRQFWPKRPTPNALALVFFGSTMAGTYYASSRFLLKELLKIRHKAEMMSRPQSQGDTSGGYGEPLFGDSAMVDKSAATFGFPEDAPNRRFA